MEKIDISIIVPVYNAEKYIKKCLDSLVNQTKKEIEIIVINDGSKDDSEKEIKNFKDTRIKYIKNKNQGIGKTRNQGIKEAQGKYLMFIDSDDYIEKDTCEVLFNKAEEDNLDLVVCDFYREDENENKIEEKVLDFENTNLKNYPEILSKINLSPWNKLYKTKMIKDNNILFVEDLKYEDTPFVFMTLDKANKIGKVNRCLNHYIIHSKSETTIRDERCFDIFEIIKIVREYFEDKEYAKENINKWIVWIITNFTIQQRNQKDINLAIDFIDHSFNYLSVVIPDYKNNKYYEGRGIKRIIEKNRTITKLYVRLYKLFSTKK